MSRPSVFKLGTSTNDVSTWRRQHSISKDDPTYYIQIATERSGVICTRLVRHELFARFPTLRKPEYTSEAGDVILPSADGAIDDDILANVVETATRNASEGKGFNMDIDEHPISSINTHVVLTLLGMQKEADILLDHMWTIFALVELTAEHVHWIWETFAPSIDRRLDAEAWPAGPYVPPYGAYYLNLAAYQILNLEAEGKLHDMVEKYVYGTETWSQPRLKHLVEQRNTKYGLRRGYDLSRQSRELRGDDSTANAFAKLQIDEGWITDRNLGPITPTYAKYYREVDYLNASGGAEVEPAKQPNPTKPTFSFDRAGLGVPTWKAGERLGHSRQQSHDDAPELGLDFDDENDNRPEVVEIRGLVAEIAKKQKIAQESNNLFVQRQAEKKLKALQDDLLAKRAALEAVDGGTAGKLSWPKAPPKPPVQQAAPRSSTFWIGSGVTPSFGASASANFPHPCLPQPASNLRKPVPFVPATQPFISPLTAGTTTTSGSMFGTSGTSQSGSFTQPQNLSSTSSYGPPAPAENKPFAFGQAPSGPFGGSATPNFQAAPAQRPNSAFNTPMGAFGTASPANRAPLHNAPPQSVFNPPVHPAGSQSTPVLNMFSNPTSAFTANASGGNMFNPQSGGGGQVPNQFNPPTNNFGNAGVGAAQGQGNNPFSFQANNGTNMFSPQPNQMMGAPARRIAKPTGRMGRR